MRPDATFCRTCGSGHTSGLGRLPDVAAFAGQTLNAPLPGGYLHACGDCGLMFRSPILADAAYTALYARGSTEVWEQSPDREDFRCIRQGISDLSVGAEIDVLDVGCYTGDLLATLPATCRLHGVEPNPDAAALARSRGIEVVAGHWDELDAASLHYDVIVACDVIEHVADPSRFLTTLSKRLKPAGRLIITTGNAQAWPWRLARARFWYCYFPEHISFISPKWLQRMAPSAGLRVERLETFSHDPLPGLLLRARALLSTCAWLLAAIVVRDDDARAPPDAHARLLGGGIARDHLFSILGKA